MRTSSVDLMLLSGFGGGVERKQQLTTEQTDTFTAQQEHPQTSTEMEGKTRQHWRPIRSSHQIQT